MLSVLRTKYADEAPLMFDCYLTETLTTSGPIKFNGCSVDLTTQDPWSGNFTVPKSGLWRFTFTATVFADSYVTDSYTYVYLNVDGERVASSLSNPEGDAYGQFDLSINSIQNLGADQSVTIESVVTGYSGLIDNADKYTHWTGMYLGLGSVVPPLCEYPGQTFQYPGSCRQYWLCQVDGSVEVEDCCPDVYVPDAEACLSEDLVVVDAVCHSEDVCA